ncbi:DUF2726 domain-containing protein [Jannaschia sp. S6380]|uniref:DUF2726 domain-containing protein n=1 Tax=Jannaschia sp. S6380 TaxID=2926408 RepID=UPI001FF1FE0B|nr:DUF2726 domain-containing protein [Jannaschia sp. S6380]MCK0169275.1 DUF2726 domain-containing protein [Jannaschia sp. S6380]
MEIIIPVILVLLIFMVVNSGTETNAKAKRSLPKKATEPEPPGQPRPESSVQKLRECTVKIRPLMSKEQATVHTFLERYATENDLLLSSEVSMSAIFSVSNKADRKLAFAAFATVRQKYVDFLLTDRDHWPLCGVEYHGSGHWSGNAVERDATKRTAFELADLPLIHIRKGELPSTLIARIDLARGVVANDCANSAIPHPAHAREADART